MGRREVTEKARGESITFRFERSIVRTMEEEGVAMRRWLDPARREPCRDCDRIGHWIFWNSACWKRASAARSRMTRRRRWRARCRSGSSGASFAATPAAMVGRGAGSASGARSDCSTARPATRC